MLARAAQPVADRHGLGVEGTDALHPGQDPVELAAPLGRELPDRPLPQSAAAGGVRGKVVGWASALATVRLVPVEF